jgi:HEAT repeat protein
MAMKRRWRLWLGLVLLLFVAASFLLPAVRWRVIGWVKGEAFYEGRPTSYWSKEIERSAEEIAPNQTTTIAKSPGMIDQLKDFVGIPRDNSDIPAVLQGDSAAMAVLSELLKDKNPLVRRQVVWAACGWVMSHRHQPDVLAVLPLLSEGLKDSEEQTRWWAVGGLVKIPPEHAEAAIPVLVEMLRQKEHYPGQALAVVELLGHIGPPAKEAIPALCELLKDEDEEFRRFAYQALTNIDPMAAAKAGVK